MFLNAMILPITKRDQQCITEHKRFVPYGSHPSFCFAKTSFTLVTLCDSFKRKKKSFIGNNEVRQNNSLMQIIALINQKGGGG